MVKVENNLVELRISVHGVVVKALINPADNPHINLQSVKAVRVKQDMQLVVNLQESKPVLELTDGTDQTGLIQIHAIAQGDLAILQDAPVDVAAVVVHEEIKEDPEVGEIAAHVANIQAASAVIENRLLEAAMEAPVQQDPEMSNPEVSEDGMMLPVAEMAEPTEVPVEEEILVETDPNKGLSTSFRLRELAITNILDSAEAIKSALDQTVEMTMTPGGNPARRKAFVEAMKLPVLDLLQQMSDLSKSFAILAEDPTAMPEETAKATEAFDYLYKKMLDGPWMMVNEAVSPLGDILLAFHPEPAQSTPKEEIAQPEASEEPVVVNNTQQEVTFTNVTALAEIINVYTSLSAAQKLAVEQAASAILPEEVSCALLLLDVAVKKGSATQKVVKQLESKKDSFSREIIAKAEEGFVALAQSFPRFASSKVAKNIAALSKATV
jgi:hypothetical protein